MPNTYILRIILADAEKNALEILADTQLRTPEEQAAMIIQNELIGYGLIKWEPTTDQMMLKVFATASDL